MLKKVARKTISLLPPVKNLYAEINKQIREKERLLETIKMQQQIHPLNTWVITEIDEDIMLWVELNDMGVSWHCIQNSYEPFETRFIKSFLEPGMTFVDIGANLGWFSLIAAKAVGSTGAVYAYEPKRSLFEHLSKSIKQNNFSWVTATNCALGDSETQLQIAWSKSCEYLGGIWLLTSDDLREELKEHCFETVDVHRLDELFPDTIVDLVKIDIEGAEYLALKGAEKTLLQHKPVIMSEISPVLLNKISGVTVAQYLDYMRQLGYKCHALDENGVGHQIYPGDITTDCVINVIFKP